MLFGYSVTSAIVIGSLLASHTLLASPIVTKLGANHLEPVTITFGATVMSDTLSLVVFAICVSTYLSGFSAFRLIRQIGNRGSGTRRFIGLGRVGAYLLRRAEDQEDAYFALLFGMMAVAGVLAQLVNLPGIVGAFLAGLAVNAAVHSKPGKDKLEFFANSFSSRFFYRDWVSNQSCSVFGPSSGQPSSCNRDHLCAGRRQIRRCLRCRSRLWISADTSIDNVVAYFAPSSSNPGGGAGSA